MCDKFCKIYLFLNNTCCPFSLGLEKITVESYRKDGKKRLQFYHQCLILEVGFLLKVTSPWCFQSRKQWWIILRTFLFVQLFPNFFPVNFDFESNFDCQHVHRNPPISNSFLILRGSPIETSWLYIFPLLWNKVAFKEDMELNISYLNVRLDKC